MLYDLNIPYSASTSEAALSSTLTLASTLGYHTVALNHIYTTVPSTKVDSPFAQLPSFDGKAIPNILHRATIHFSDAATQHIHLANLIKIFDIIAVRPTSDEAFSKACLSLDVSIISLDLTQHHPFYFRIKPCMMAVNRGVRFEIAYAQALQADARGRALFISNATQLIRATRGRGIMLASEARSALMLRAPADVVNLLSVWGLGSEKGMEGLGSVPRSVVVNEAMKRTGFRGVVDIVQVADKGPDEVQPAAAAKQEPKQKRKGDKEAGNADKKNKKMKVVSREAPK
ncbi:RNase P subunit p30-domain-containing protein [Emericellopsis atlantica]|uniref:RNase P subunit p30-domain-containing protein n=1 Tax=Emericellopsis atlantica TaxID=2614577 RepID=A0A9P8CRA5_9HYPO|nr:RNase P subunit p30-domain-containing protein [Emericellopsis atlantica]KAG9256107.1 RNase P subunit p30-domain-containing protein [Emericellopsis atlantica]